MSPGTSIVATSGLAETSPTALQLPQFRADGTIWFEASATLVVSDLHFEKGSAFARRGSLLPPYDTAETVRRLALALEQTGARRLVSLGDSFHDVTAGQRMAPAVRDRLLAVLAGLTCVWVEGNHDPLLPGWLPGVRLEAIEIEGWTLRHEPSPVDQPHCEIAGHLHPCAKVAGRTGRQVRRRCFAVSQTRIIMPAFGAFTGGLNLCDPAFTAHFAAPPTAIVLGSNRLHRIGPAQLLPD